MSANTPERVDNIGPRGAAERRVAGQIGLAASIAIAVALFFFHAPRQMRLILLLPLVVAATGFLQARERT